MFIQGREFRQIGKDEFACLVCGWVYSKREAREHRHQVTQVKYGVDDRAKSPRPCTLATPASNSGRVGEIVSGYDARIFTSQGFWLTELTKGVGAQSHRGLRVLGRSSADTQ